MRTHRFALQFGAGGDFFPGVATAGERGGTREGQSGAKQQIRWERMRIDGSTAGMLIIASVRSVLL